MMLFAALWLLAGVVSFVLMKAAWALEFGCGPVRVRTLISGAFASLVPPLCLLLAAVYFLCWLIGNDDHSAVPSPLGRLSRVLDREIANPCRWFHDRKKEQA